MAYLFVIPWLTSGPCHGRYETFLAVKRRVHLAVFDDTNLDPAFPALLSARGERAWHTWDCGFASDHADGAQLRPIGDAMRAAADSLLPGAEAAAAVRDAAREALVRRKVADREGRLVFHGGMEDLARFHLSIVRGGAWQ